MRIGVALRAINMVQASGGSVLVVEDEEVIREVLSFQAQALGLQVYEAANGKEALQILREKSADAVLSDLRMPQMSGMMLLHTMREEGIHVPFIFVTAFASTDTTIQALRLGAFDFIEKPFQAHDIEQVLLEAVRVGREQSKLASAMPYENVKGPLEAAEVQIMKMRTLRDSSDEIIPSAGEIVAPTEGSSDEGERSRLIKLFAAEALPQLAFCKASLQGLQDEKQRPFELGYLFRVMQAIRMSAMAINLDQVAALASETEAVCTYFRVNPRSIKLHSISVLHEALDSLVQGIDCLSHNESLPLDTAIIRKLEELHDHS